MSPTGQERRKSKRRPVLSTFSVFVVVPKKGIHRLQIHDISDTGIGFDLDTDGEALDSFPMKTGEALDIRFYLNQSLYIPLAVQVVRLDQRGTVRKVGAEFEDKSSKGFKAYLAFIQLLDSISDSLELEGSMG